MPIRPLSRLLVCCGLFMVLAGCWSEAEPTGNSGGPSNTGSGYSQSDRELPPPPPLLDGWTPPAVALLLSGEQAGYLEPCGCSLTQSGGVSRRADLFRQIEEQEWPYAAFDLGGTLRRNRRQSQIKFETILAALRDMRYSAIGLGVDELRLEQSSPGYLLSQHQTDPDSSDETLDFLSANVVLFDTPDLGTPVRSKTVTVNEVRIGVTSLVGKRFRKTLLPSGNNSELSILDPEAALPPVLDDLKAEEPHLLVLLSYASLEESREFAKQFPEFDIIVSAGGPEDPDSRPEVIGETLLVTVGRKGKYVGVVGFYPDETDQRLRYELVDLDNQRFQDTPRMEDHMRYYQERLREERLAELEPPISHSRDARFVGAKKCGECHTKAYKQWQLSKHAHAYDSLETGRPGQEERWISRIHDAECLSCHVTGWHPQEALRYDSGFVSAEETPWLRGQQCENCHGPGSQHVEFEEIWRNDRQAITLDEVNSGRRDMKLTLELAKRQVCYQCHDLDNSPNFDFDTYWEKIKHPWRD